jgi:hypothetical protein
MLWYERGLALPAFEQFRPDLYVFVVLAWSSPSLREADFVGVVVRCSAAVLTERGSSPSSATRITNTLGANRTLALLASDSYPRASRYAGGGDQGGGGDDGGVGGIGKWLVVEERNHKAEQRAEPHDLIRCRRRSYKRSRR